jgi:hypothetical protein
MFATLRLDHRIKGGGRCPPWDSAVRSAAADAPTESRIHLGQKALAPGHLALRAHYVAHVSEVAPLLAVAANLERPPLAPDAQK